MQWDTIAAGILTAVGGSAVTTAGAAFWWLVRRLVRLRDELIKYKTDLDAAFVKIRELEKRNGYHSHVGNGHAYPGKEAGQGQGRNGQSITISQSVGSCPVCGSAPGTSGAGSPGGKP